MQRIRLTMTVCALLPATSSHAGSMGFEGSGMAKGDLGPSWRDTWVNYALTSRDAVGGLGAMRGNDFDGTKFVYTPGL